MEAKGFILRQSVASDARLKKVLLTEKGIIIQKKVNRIISQSEQALRDELTDSEYYTLVSIIDKLSKTDFKGLNEEKNHEK
jgi:DNA-binding MarR family transcriptional regulator